MTEATPARAYFAKPKLSVVPRRSRNLSLKPRVARSALLYNCYPRRERGAADTLGPAAALREATPRYRSDWLGNCESQAFCDLHLDLLQCRMYTMRTRVRPREVCTRHDSSCTRVRPPLVIGSVFGNEALCEAIRVCVEMLAVQEDAYTTFVNTPCSRAAGCPRPTSGLTTVHSTDTR